MARSMMNTENKTVTGLGNAPDVKTYNGWTNYETWVVKLWMDNEEGTYNFWVEQTRNVYESALPKYGLSQKEIAKSELADCLKEQHEEMREEWKENSATVFDDLMNAAMSEINWYEIAEALIEDNIEETVEE
jgi:hypothetical protein